MTQAEIKQLVELDVWLEIHVFNRKPASSDLETFYASPAEEAAFHRAGLATPVFPLRRFSLGTGHALEVFRRCTEVHPFIGVRKNRVIMLTEHGGLMGIDCTGVNLEVAVCVFAKALFTFLENEKLGRNDAIGLPIETVTQMTRSSNDH